MDHLHELLNILPVIFSLIVIEGLLSVDNALAIAALASKLPKEQQKTALRLGIIGAYLFRGVALALVAVIIKNPWLKIIGSAYLIYLMASNLAASDEDEEEEDGAAGGKRRSLFMTILQIEAMDLALSLDNVVAAVALDKRIWVVCTGVFIGILALRFLAGFSIKLIEKYPVLEPTAFLLIGFVGVILCVEVSTELAHGGHGVEISSLQKFTGIILILALALFYERTALGKTLLGPVVVVGQFIMTALDKILGLIFWPAAKCIHWGKAVFARKPAVAQELTPP